VIEPSSLLPQSEESTARDVASNLFDDAILNRRLARAAHTSWDILGKTVTFYLPGMIRYGDERGRYPAISISGSECELKCDHCRGKLLQPMIPASTPEHLYKKAIKLWQNGAIGCLISGGSDREGRLDWFSYLETIRRIKGETDLLLSIHSGFLEQNTALGLKQAGISQALVDVVGHEETYIRIFHLEKGMQRVRQTLENINEAGMELVPHIVAGIEYGVFKGEYRALELISEHSPRALVIVVLFPFPDTPMAAAKPPKPEQLADLFIYARELMPDVPQSLGCEHPRGADGDRLEELAIMGGVNRIAVQSDHALNVGQRLGLTMNFQKTCCSWPLLEQR
jgi:lipoyl synthase